jgi:hypothetical protein
VQNDEKSCINCPHDPMEKGADNVAQLFRIRLVFEIQIKSQCFVFCSLFFTAIIFAYIYIYIYTFIKLVTGTIF